MVPDRISSQATSSEAEIFDLIREASDSDGCYCLHSLGIARHERKNYAECDFVFVGREGIFCLEVKGGEVKRKDGVWEIGWPGKRYTSPEGPFKQSQSCRWSLLKELEKRLGLNIRRNSVLGWGVVFPDIVFDQQDPEWSRDVVYDQRDKSHSFMDYIRRLESYERSRIDTTRHPQPLPMGHNRVREIVDCIRGDFDVVSSIGGLILESERELVRLSEEQYKVLDFVLNDGNPRILCDGAAGSGKSLIALEAARRLSRLGRKVLMLCFNENLAKHFSREVHFEGDDVDLAGVYAFFRRIIQSGGYGSELSAANNSFLGDELYLQHYPALFERAIDELLEEGDLPQYDVLIIDEGQDVLSGPIFNCLDLVLSGGFEKGRWLILLDSGFQSKIYNQFSDEVLIRLNALGPVTLKLHENFRNPRQVVTEVCAVTQCDPPICRRRLDSPVEYRTFEDRSEQPKLLRQILSELADEGVPASKITVLSPNKNEESTAAKLPEKSRATFLNEGPLEGEILTASTVSGFKGLENDIIILTDFPEVSSMSDWESSVVYVGMTRAKSRLYVLTNKDFVEYRFGDKAS